MPDPKAILVTDFDGTITAVDFYVLAVENLLTPADLAPWHAYAAGTITHFEAVRDIFLRIRAPESHVLALLQETRPDPELPRYVEALRRAGWGIVVASAGCDWYIDKILAQLGVVLDVHCNPGVYHEGGPLDMTLPLDDPFCSKEYGIDKSGIVRHYLDAGLPVVYAGNGPPDVAPSLLLPPSRRFARTELAEALTASGEGFRPFSVWSDVAKALLAEPLPAAARPVSSFLGGRS